MTSWGPLRLKRLFESSRGGSWGSDPDDQADVIAPCIRGTDFDYATRSIAIDRAPLRGFTCAEFNLRAAKAGDIVIEKSGGGELQPVGRAVLHSAHTSVVPTNFAGRLRPNHRVESRFATYLLASLYSDGRTRAAIKQTTGIQNLDVDALLTNTVVVPGVGEQRAIADYLDSETARIDALIAKKRRLIELLAERWRASVDELTAVGDPVRVRHVTSLRTSGPRGWGENAGEVGSPFIRSANLNRASVSLDSANLARVEAPNTPEASRSRVQVGDSLVGITGANTGWVGFVDDRFEGGFVSQHVAILRPSGVEPLWLSYSLFAPRAQNALLGGQYGGTKQQLGLQDLAQLPIAVPSVAEQRDLIRQLRVERTRTERLSTVIEHQIDLIVERRQAVITAAVTGELAIPGAAA